VRARSAAVNKSLSVGEPRVRRGKLWKPYRRICVPLPLHSLHVTCIWVYLKSDADDSCPDQPRPVVRDDENERHDVHAGKDLLPLHLDAAARAAAALDDVTVRSRAGAAAVVAEDHLVELELIEGEVRSVSRAPEVGQPRRMSVPRHPSHYRSRQGRPRSRSASRVHAAPLGRLQRGRAETVSAWPGRAPENASDGPPPPKKREKTSRGSCPPLF
jgi:hypothetical protein